MVKQLFILIFFILVGQTACKGKLSSKDISQLAKDIAEDNVLKGAAVGIAGEQPRQWDRYEALRSKATDKELLSLTKDTNAVVRCYAFQALAERNTNVVFSIALHHLSDTATIHTLYGCVGGSQKVGDFFLQTLLQKDEDGKLYRLNDNQKASIDSILLFDKGNKLETRDRLFLDLQPFEQYYQRLRQIAVEENSKIAVIALARYKKQQDKPLIEKLLTNANGQTFGFAAVVNFPDQSFHPFLHQILVSEIAKSNSGNDQRLQLLYQAIVQYKDPPSRQLLQTILHEAKGIQHIYHSDYLHQALKKYPASIYNGILKPNYSGAPVEKSGA